MELEDLTKLILQGNQVEFRSARRNNELRAVIKAPEGMFAVYAWDLLDPERNVPLLVQTLRTRRDAVYSSEKSALNYARSRNERWFRELEAKRKAGEMPFGEMDYFVVDDKGCRR